LIATNGFVCDGNVHECIGHVLPPLMRSVLSGGDADVQRHQAFPRSARPDQPTGIALADSLVENGFGQISIGIQQSPGNMAVSPSSSC
jgi:hypothetical protein